MTHETAALLIAGALVLSAASFTWQYRRALAAGRSTTFAPARGNPARGARYAFTLGMDPRRKDGVRRHPAVLVAGALFHIGIFTSAAAFVLLLATDVMQEPRVSVPVACLLGFAAVAGLALFARRLRTPMLAAISRTDDYASNALVVAWLAATAAAVVAPSMLGAAATLTVALLLYAPFGKIRHCVFFFPARLQYGRFLGRRGVIGGATAAAPQAR